jgi:predicted nucleotidyltransferase component of viral defense system
VADRTDIQEDPRVIDRDEIDATSKLLGVDTSNVQRDYLYGWLLAGLYGDNPLMRDRLVLKGGNAFRKGYFVNTRFSGDLDFAAPTGQRSGQSRGHDRLRGQRGLW